MIKGDILLKKSLVNVAGNVMYVGELTLGVSPYLKDSRCTILLGTPNELYM